MKDIFLSAFPVGIGYLAGCSERAGHEVRVEDLYHFSSWDQVTNHLWPVVRNFGPDVVGIPCLTTMRHTVFELTKRIKSWRPEIRVVLGGHHATFMYEQILRNYPQIDVVCLGESEKTFVELIDTLDGSIDPQNVPGLAYRRQNQVLTTLPRKQLQSLDELPVIPYHLFDLDLYNLITPIYKHQEWHGQPLFHYNRMTLVTSRGCPFDCTFCSSSTFWGHTCRYIDDRRVVDEIELLYDRYQIRFFEFLDDLFTVNKKRLEAICAELRRRGLSIAWTAYARVDSVNRETLSIMKESGCLGVFYGVESGSVRLLKSMHKTFSLEQIRQAFALTKALGMQAYFLLLAGFPGEDEDSMADTRRLIQEVEPDNIFTGGPLIIYPGTRIYRQALDEGVLDETAWITDHRKDILYTGRYKESILRSMVKKLLFSRKDITRLGEIDSDPIRKIMILDTGEMSTLQETISSLHQVLPEAEIKVVSRAKEDPSKNLTCPVVATIEKEEYSPETLQTLIEHHLPNLLIIIKDYYDSWDTTGIEKAAVAKMPEGRAVLVNNQGRLTVLEAESREPYWTRRKEYDIVRKKQIERFKLRLPDFPRRIDLEITNLCNIQCTICPRSDMVRPRQHMSPDLWQSIIDEIREYGLVDSWFHLFGEPLLHPRLFDMLEYAHRSRAFLHSGLSTNGMKLSLENSRRLIESGLHRIVISLDGVDEESYQKVRSGGNYHRVINNIEGFMEEYKRSTVPAKPEVLIQIIETPVNQEMVTAFEKRWSERLDPIHGIQLYKKRFMDFAGTVDLVNQSENPEPNLPCVGLWFEMAVYSDGRVVTCCFDSNGSQEVGDLKQKGLHEIWHSREFEAFRQSHQGRSWAHLPLCKQCRTRQRPQYCDSIQMLET